MASHFQSRPPVWFTLAALLLTLWGLVGCATLYMHFGIGPDASASQYDRDLYRSMPLWVNLSYILAVISGMMGAVGLLLKRAWAVLLSAISLICVVAQFGWVFAATDIIAMKGLWVVYFPAFVFIVQSVQLWMAGKGKRRRWLR